MLDLQYQGLESHVQILGQLVSLPSVGIFKMFMFSFCYFLPFTESTTIIYLLFTAIIYNYYLFTESTTVCNCVFYFCDVMRNKLHCVTSQKILLCSMLQEKLHYAFRPLAYLCQEPLPKDSRDLGTKQEQRY